MSNYDNTNKGQIWKNDNKATGTHPDFKGSINIEGVDYWLSCWKRSPEASPKAPALKMSVQRKEVNQGQAAQQNQADKISNINDDDIPF
jgi:hypothetical protein